MKNFTFFHITNTDDREHHYQLKGGKNKRISDNGEKLTAAFDYHNTNFGKSDCVYNLPKNLQKCF